MTQIRNLLVSCCFLCLACACHGAAATVADADAAVIVTEWAQLKTLARPEIRDAMVFPLIVDGRNLLDPDEARANGFAYEGIGRPTVTTDGEPVLAGTR